MLYGGLDIYIYIKVNVKVTIDARDIDTNECKRAYIQEQLNLERYLNSLLIRLYGEW